jgi:hypothetical protein
MDMRRVRLITATLIAGLAIPASGQTSIAACGEPGDPSARQVHKVFGDLRVCMVAVRPAAEAEFPRDWAARASTIVLETQQPGDNRRAAIEGSRVTWTVNGRPAPVDSTVERWQRAVIDLLDAAHERDQLRGTANDLRSRIDSLPARRAATRARIDDIERRDAALSQQMVALESRERLRRDEITRLRQRHGQVQSQATAEQNRAANADERTRAAIEANARRLAQEADRLEDQLLRLERQEASDDLRKRISDLSYERASLNVAEATRYLQLQLTALDSTNVREIEQQIQQLTAGGRFAILDAQVDERLKGLRALLAIR